MERWSLKFLNSNTGNWERFYYYDIQSFATARDKMEEDPNKINVFSNYEKFEMVK